SLEGPGNVLLVCENLTTWAEWEEEDWHVEEGEEDRNEEFRRVAWSAGGAEDSVVVEGRRTRGCPDTASFHLYVQYGGSIGWRNLPPPLAQEVTTYLALVRARAAAIAREAVQQKALQRHHRNERGH